MKSNLSRQPRSGKSLSTQQAVNRAIKNICDILRRSNCAGAMQYIPELTWMLFLRILDEQESIEAGHAQAAENVYEYSLESPYRWCDWAAPYRPLLSDNLDTRKPQGWKRRELNRQGEGAFLKFVNQQLFPYLQTIGDHPNASARQKVISKIAANIGRTQVDTEYNLLDVLDKVHQISTHEIDTTHVFPLSQVYEGLLLRMGHKSNDGGQFFTPREIVRAMIQVIDPRFGETVYDPCCGTGGFLAQAHEHMQSQPGRALSRFYGREKEKLVYPIALANLILHGIDEPHIWHGNTLTGQEIYGGLFVDAPAKFDVVLTNPPFCGKESKKAQELYAYKSSATQILFLQHVINSLKPNGRCGIVVDEGMLFRTNETAYVQTKQWLLNTCDVWCIVSLPIGAFVNAGATIKTNLLFFTKGQATQSIWYYDLSNFKVTKKTPLTLEHFKDFFHLLPHRATSTRSWSVPRQQIEENGYDLKALNPSFSLHQEGKSTEELLHLIEDMSQTIQSILCELDACRIQS